MEAFIDKAAPFAVLGAGLFLAHDGWHVAGPALVFVATLKMFDT